MTYTRTKKLTDSSYSPTTPVSELSIRTQIDGAIQEILDLLNAGKAEQTYVDSTFITVLNSYTKSQIDALLAGLVLGQLTPGSVIDSMLSNTAGQLKDMVTKLDTPYPTTNVGNVYSVTVPNVTSLTDGLPVLIKWNADSSGSVTLNVNGLGAKNVIDGLKNVVTNVKSGTISDLRYALGLTSFQLLGKGGGGNATSNDLRSGLTATVDSGQITGTMDLTNKTSGNIKNAVTIDGTTGTYVQPNTTVGDSAFYDSGSISIASANTTYTKVKEIKINSSGNIRVKMTLTSSTGIDIYATVYKNGVAIGTERSKNTNGSVSFSEDFSVLQNDLIQIYIKYVSVAGGTLTNMQICSANTIFATVNL